MAQSYSEDFRQKVMQAIELDGLKKSEASQLFSISRNMINLWCQRKAKTGDSFIFNIWYRDHLSLVVV